MKQCCCTLPRVQDDASEDPLTAARAGATGAAELYWKQKMVPSIKEVFATCLSSNALQVPGRRCLETTVIFESGLQHCLPVLDTATLLWTETAEARKHQQICAPSHQLVFI